MVDALFGSKTRVKLLHLFLNNPGKAFYVREITRLIDEQINSVRRELANMLEVGIISSRNTDNKLYYEVNQRYEHYSPLRTMFANQQSGGHGRVSQSIDAGWEKLVQRLSGVRIAIAAGRLVDGSASSIDLLLAGDIPKKKLDELVATIEQAEGRELTYTVIPYDEFYYRLSVRDKFITSVLTNKHTIITDIDSILKEQ